MPAPVPEAPEILPPPVADQVLDQVATRLRELQRSASLDFAVQVGALLVEQLYGGDLSAWQERGVRDASFRKLAERDDLGGLGKSTLHRSVQVYALVERLGRPDWKHLGVAHVRAVLPLPEKDQARLLERAEAHQWTTRQLEAEADKRKPPPDGRGRPPLPTFVKSIHALARIVEIDGDGDPFADLDAVDALSEDDARRLLAQVSQVRQRCEEVERRLGPKVPAAAG
ncbi:hypothetical protein L6R53_20435 [Myxococcota bacterium]|nr:hypothetical protein [Myxococcota bacterium]